MEVVAINRSEACAILANGVIVYFANMFDAFGDETADVSECVSAVAPLPNGEWAVIDVSEFETVTVH